MTAAAARHLSLVSGDEHQDQDHADTIAALVDEFGTLAVELDRERAQHATTRVELERMRAAFLPRSDERDQWQARALAYFGDGFRAGFEAGEQVGAERAIIAWKVTAGTLDGGPTYAELDRRRYPPNGRASWMLPRLADTYAAWAEYAEQDGAE